MKVKSSRKHLNYTERYFCIFLLGNIAHSTHYFWAYILLKHLEKYTPQSNNIFPTVPFQISAFLPWLYPQASWGRAGRFGGEFGMNKRRQIPPAAWQIFWSAWGALCSPGTASTCCSSGRNWEPWKRGLSGDLWLRFGLVWIFSVHPSVELHASFKLQSSSWLCQHLHPSPAHGMGAARTLQGCFGGLPGAGWSLQERGCSLLCICTNRTKICQPTFRVCQVTVKWSY